MVILIKGGKELLVFLQRDFRMLDFLCQCLYFGLLDGNVFQVGKHLLHISQVIYVLT